MNARILVTKPIPQVGLAMLEPYGRLEIGPAGRAFTAAELRRRAAGTTAILSFVADPLDAAVLEAAAPTCKVVANFGVGTDNIDLAAATRLGIRVTNTPDVLTDATADLAFALLLAVARRLPSAVQIAASGAWPGVEPVQIFGCDVARKTLGIVGAGRIGTAVARRAAGFDMPVVYTSRRANEPLEAAGARRLDLDELLATADFISLHVPLTPETRHLIAAPQLARMKHSAYLINTARGAVVCERDLIEALRREVISGAGLDVYDREPHIPAELLRLPNVVCLPHIGSATHETRARMAEVAAANLIACLESREPPNPVN